MGNHLRYLLQGLVATALFIQTAHAAVQFEEVTSQAGFTYSGQSYGASWGDFSGDGLPDLWVNNHVAKPNLYLNKGDGTFNNVLDLVWFGDPKNDTHGAAWADFDNDGDQDLLSLAGGGQGVGQVPNQLFVNDSGVLTDQAVVFGLDYPFSRGRTGTWFDYNNDGFLDVILSARNRSDKQAPTALFSQGKGLFSNISTEVVLHTGAAASFSQISDLNGDGVMDLIIHSPTRYPQHVYDITQVPFVDVAKELGLNSKPTDVWDVAIADFNGDLLPDIYMTRVIDPRKSSDVVAQADGVTISARLKAKKEELGFSFVSNGDLSISFPSFNTIQPNQIFIGSGGRNPANLELALSAADPTVNGIQDHVAGVDTGLYIGYDPVTTRWTIELSGTKLIHIITTASSTITDLQHIGASEWQPLVDRYMVHNGVTYTNQTVAAGFTAADSCLSVTSGDFDNDMDIDLYLVCNSPASNLPNIFYENQGDGTFVSIEDAGGAAGSMLGRGEVVVSADYDGDGFLDLFLTNGMYTAPFNNGPQQLFRNQGNSNHWIEIDLKGTLSNSNGIGARVLLTAGGVTQLREMNGSIHRHAQDHQRLHFGLATNTTIERLEIHWPDGAAQVLKNVDVDQILQILEPSQPVLSIENATIDERAGTATFTVSLSEASTQTVTVQYGTSDQTANNNADYLAVPGELVFLPGETRKTISVEIVQDNLDEPDETFALELSGASNAFVENASAIVTITRLPIWFDDVTSETGVAYYGLSAGLAWGDLNRDRCPDLWTSNHYQRASLYLNTCDGGFTTADPSTYSWIPDQDSHAAAWADFDNDGDQDLTEFAGDDLNLLYKNADNTLEDIAGLMGVEGCPSKNGGGCVLTRTRTPLWLDWNVDGLLDMLMVNDSGGGGAPSILLQQTADGFKDVGSSVGFEGVGNAAFAHLADLSGNGALDLILHDGSSYPARVYELDGESLRDITTEISVPRTTSVQDVVTADFNGDLSVDLFLARGTRASSDVRQIDETTIGFRLAGKNSEKGVRFTTSGDLSFTILRFLDESDIFIGAGGVNPAETGVLRSNGLIFTLSPDDPDVQGVLEHVPGGVNGVFIGFDPLLDEWVVLRSATSSKPINPLGVEVSSSASITRVAAVNFEPFIPGRKNALYLHDGTTLIDATVQAGLSGIAGNCFAAAAGDFDNDMDVDLYTVCSRPAGNIANQLYANDGQGVFTPLPRAGGAAGAKLGAGDGVALADYDQDGFLDLLVANSDRDMTFFGSNQLFRNAGNPNHWIEIDLQGVESNRDGIGARVIIETPDGKRQLREQSGGMHRFAQDHQRIHVGLGKNRQVTSIEVFWPGGTSQTIAGVLVDQVIQIIEPVTPTLLGQPDMSSDIGAVYLWKDTLDGPYHLRVKSSEQSTFDVRLLSSEPVDTIDVYQLEKDDSFISTDYGFSLQSNVSAAGEDGVDFSLPLGARVLLSVERDGISNPRQIHVGASGRPLSPAGWIKSFKDLPARPALVKGLDTGLFIGKSTDPTVLEARWSSSASKRAAGVSLIASQAVPDIKLVELERNDVAVQTLNSINIEGLLGPGIDGVDMPLAPDSLIGIVYQQDNLIAPSAVNWGAINPGDPNAYWLPTGQVVNADFDNNGVVDFGDLSYMKSVFFTADPLADLDKDGTVGFSDLVLLKKQLFR